jgi:hypothetical protein
VGLAISVITNTRNISRKRRLRLRRLLDCVYMLSWMSQGCLPRRPKNQQALARREGRGRMSWSFSVSARAKERHYQLRSRRVAGGTLRTGNKKIGLVIEPCNGLCENGAEELVRRDERILVKCMSRQGERSDCYTYWGEAHSLCLCLMRPSSHCKCAVFDSCLSGDFAKPGFLTTCRLKSCSTPHEPL